MCEMKEPVTIEKKKLAMKLAYQIVTDKRNGNRYACTGIVQKNSTEIFGYGDMLCGLQAIFDEIANPPMHKPLPLETAKYVTRNTVMYLETRCDDECEPPDTIWIRLSSQRGSITIYFDGCVGLTPENEIDWEKYGIDWRLWDSEPSDAEKSAAPWKVVQEDA